LSFTNCCCCCCCCCCIEGHRDSVAVPLWQLQH
jgi:hypothetical protein